MKLAELIREAVIYLQDQQRVDGSFPAASRALKQPHRGARRQPTVFPTLLITHCLRNVPGTALMREAAVRYIQTNMSPQGSWNYWEQQSPLRQSEPYPDDLDDTACALAVLAQFNPTLVNGERLGQFARLLIAAEERPGGPYNTWLIDSKVVPQWHQIDIAVNANIGYALSLHDVTVGGLTQYVDECLKSDAIQSAYYVGILPVVYFLARWYKGEQLSALKTKLAKEAARVTDPLELALALTAGCNIGLASAQLDDLALKLQSTAKNAHWPPAAFYIDPVYEGQQHYGGSAALTTAFALEALITYSQQASKNQKRITAKRTAKPDTLLLGQLKKQAATIGNRSLRQRYVTAMKHIMESDSGKQISAPANLLAKAGKWEIPKQTLMHLNLASLNGWLAYTIYDDFLDGEGQADLLNVANLSLRRSYDNYLQALPDNAAFRKQVITAFDIVDGANAWELTNTRAAVKSGSLRIIQLPQYGDCERLAERSWGHSLAALGTLLTALPDIDHRYSIALQSFFHYFLIARQLNDDAHDWEDDIQQGRITLVVGMLLQAQYSLPHTLRLDAELDQLREHFWLHTIEAVAEKIHANIVMARRALRECSDIFDTAAYSSWLHDIERSVALAMQGRNQTLQFIKAYGANDA